MSVFGIFKFLDARYLVKRVLQDNNVQESCKKLIPLLKEKIQLLAEEYSSSKEKLKDIPGTNYKLGLRHMHRGNLSDAIFRFRMVCFLTPENIDAQYNLGRAFALSGEIDNAIKQFEKILLLDSKFVDAQYQLDKITQPASVNSVPFNIIMEKEDYKSELYKKNFLDLDYKGSTILINEVLRNVKDKNPNFEVLDLGCGVGESATLLKQKNVAKRIVGVDISDNMLKEAVKRSVDNQNVYDKVVKAEISRFLSSHTENYDLIVSDLSFCHFGDLSNIALSLNMILKSEGILAFILQKDDAVKTHYTLDIDKDEFIHSEAYIKDTFTKHTFKLLDILEIDLPEEKLATIFIFKK